jgi:hypothetical protein
MKEKKQRPPKPDGVKASPRFARSSNPKRGRRRHANINEQRRIALYGEFRGMSDSAAAIIGANLLEHQLALSIMARLVKLSPADHNRIFDGESAVLGRFHAKIQIGYALGIYGKKEYDELMLVKAIRNRFAHNLFVKSFRHPLLRRDCSKLMVPKHRIWVAEILAEGEKPARGHRAKYFQSVIGLEVFLFQQRSKPRRPRRERGAYLADPIFEAWLQNADSGIGFGFKLKIEPGQGVGPCLDHLWGDLDLRQRGRVRPSLRRPVSVCIAHRGCSFKYTMPPEVVFVRQQSSSALRPAGPPDRCRIPFRRPSWCR